MKRGPIYFWLEDFASKDRVADKDLPQIHPFWNYLEIRNFLQPVHGIRQENQSSYQAFHTNAPSLQLGHNWSRSKSPDKDLVAIYWLYVRDGMHADTFAAQTTSKLWIHQTGIVLRL